MSPLCCWFHSLPQTPLLSLFSINSFQSLYAPCNNPGKRARKTLFFLTLIPIDPVLQWYHSLSRSISANRILQTQELEPLIYCTGKWDTMPTGNQTNTRLLGDWPSAYDIPGVLSAACFGYIILFQKAVSLITCFIIILWPAGCQIKINVCCFVFIGFD